MVGRRQRGKIAGAARFSLRGEIYPGQIEPPQQFEQKKPDGAPIEVEERMHRKKPSFGKGEQLNGQIRHLPRRRRPARGEIRRVELHLFGDPMGRRRLPLAHRNRNRAPPARSLGHEVATDLLMQVEQELRSKRGVGPEPGIKRRLGERHTLGKQRG